MSTNEKKNKYFTFTNHKDIYIDYPMRLVENGLKNVYLENKFGDTIKEYFIGDPVVLVIETTVLNEEVQIVLNCSGGPGNFEDVEKIIIDGFEKRIDLTLEQKWDIIEVKCKEKILKCQVSGVHRKGFGVNYVRIDGENISSEYERHSTDEPYKAHRDRSGLQYKIWIYDSNKNETIERDTFFKPREEKEKGFQIDYGLYSGPTCLTKVNKFGVFLPRKIGNYDYSIEPIDAVDAGACLHDRGYDAVEAEGEDALTNCWACIPADIKAVEDWQNVTKLGVRASDPEITLPITTKEVEQAALAILLFKSKIAKKKKEVAEWMMKYHPKEAVKEMVRPGKNLSWVAKPNIEENYKLFLKYYMKKEGQFWITKDNEIGIWKYNKIKKYKYLSENY